MALNLSGVERTGLWGKLLRAPLALIPRGATVRVLQGPARGLRWIVGSSTHGCWLGSYEYAKRRTVERLIRSNAVVYDVGANVGFYTLLSSVLVRPSGQVVSFEPLPRNVAYLRRHVEMNRLHNVTVMPIALGERSGVARFREAADASMGSLCEDGSLAVQVESMDDLVARALIPEADVIKMDIEGGELAALRGAQALLARRRPVIVLATHGAEIHDQCCRLLTGLGYDLTSLDSRAIASTDELLATSGRLT